MKITTKDSLVREFLIEQFGDESSPLWEIYFETLLITTYLKLPKKEKVSFRKSIDNEETEKIISIIEKTLDVVDYMNISDKLKDGIMSSIE